jgi:hypothetical protein
MTSEAFLKFLIKVNRETGSYLWYTFNSKTESSKWLWRNCVDMTVDTVVEFSKEDRANLTIENMDILRDECHAKILLLMEDDKKYKDMPFGEWAFIYYNAMKNEYPDEYKKTITNT